jgi:hypothetical protein
MAVYSIETIKSEKRISFSGISLDLKKTAHKIAIPWNVDESDLAQITEYVDKLRKNYPSQPWMIYRHIKEIVNY